MIRILGALGIGAAFMYFYDPVSGRRRREQLRERMTHYQNEVTQYAEGATRDLRTRAEGLVAEARGMVERRMGQRRKDTQFQGDQGSQVDMELNR